MSERDFEREALADLLTSDAVMRAPEMGRDYALVEADAVLAWIAERGYRKQAGPEPEWEYGVCNNNTNGRIIGNGDYRIGQTHRRVKAGPWEPVEEVLAWTPNEGDRG